MSGYRNQLLVGDVRAMLPTLPTDLVDSIVTSPPYFQLRNYQQGGQLGLEPSVQAWIDEMVGVATELRRILKPTGTLWLNLGDTYCRRGGQGAPPKSLLLGPERIALGMTASGWILRNKIVWAKPNPMPTSIGDRLNTTYEVVYCFAASPRYFFDLDAIRVPHRSRPLPSREKGWSVPPAWRTANIGSNGGLAKLKASGVPGHPLGKNPGDVWTVPTASYRGAHHAVYPEALVERPLLAGCPERICSACGHPWRRSAARTLGHLAVMGSLLPACDCTATWRPGLVLDPFMGSGTTAVVAERLDRDWLGVELSPEFAAAATARIHAARDRPAA